MMEEVDNDFLATYLDTIDERLLDYLDDEENLSVDSVKRLQRYASGLLDGSITPLYIMEEWPDWYSLVPAFVIAYGTGELEELEQDADFLVDAKEGDDMALSRGDRVCLQALEVQLGMYPEIRQSR
jgi:hypothetical protein